MNRKKKGYKTTTDTLRARRLCSIKMLALLLLSTFIFIILENIGKKARKERRERKERCQY